MSLLSRKNILYAHCALMYYINRVGGLYVDCSYSAVRLAFMTVILPQLNQTMVTTHKSCNIFQPYSRTSFTWILIIQCNQLLRCLFINMYMAEHGNYIAGSNNLKSYSKIKFCSFTGMLSSLTFSLIGFAIVFRIENKHHAWSE